MAVDVQVVIVSWLWIEMINVDKIMSCFIPNMELNPYTANVKRILSENDIEIYPIKKILADPTKFIRCMIFNFNWYENIRNRRQYYVRVLLIKLLKLFGKKIIYTVHNKQPHNSRDKGLTIEMMRKMAINADMILGLCPDTREVVAGYAPQCVAKIRYTMHPNYIHNYQNKKLNDYRDKLGFTKDDMILLFMGFVSPYKNLELLVDIFKQLREKDIKLLVAGLPYNDEYKMAILKNVGETPNIVCDFRYIPDDEIVSFYNTCNVAVMPYNKSSSLNSGAVYLAFSLKRTVICPDIGTMRALEDHSFVYQYEYNDESEHKKELRRGIMKAYEDFSKDPEIVTNKGCVAYEYVKRVHSDEKIGKIYRELYEELL